MPPPGSASTTPENGQLASEKKGFSELFRLLKQTIPLPSKLPEPGSASTRTARIVRRPVAQ